MKLLFVFLLFGGLSVNTQAATKNYTYVITETSGPTSFDPLEADQTQNLPVARMLYATPIEVDSEDRLSSQILKSFNYEPSTKTLTWVLRDDIKYSNGTKITAHDIAFSVARMAFTRPKFPVIENILGLSSWLSEKEPLSNLPQGIKVTENKVEITFSKTTRNPLFRFCLELFSVIPKSCVDLKTNKISCSKIPSSGKFELVSKKEVEIQFKEKSQNSNFTFKYMPIDEALQKISSFDDNTILAGNEIMFSTKDLSHLKENGKVLFLPAARFGILQINPTAKPFNDKVCRHVFAEKFRESYKKTIGDVGISESSIFTGIVTGYLKPHELKNNSAVKISDASYSKCLKDIQDAQIFWGYVESEKNSNFSQALLETLKFFNKGTVNPKLYKSRKEIAQAFINNEISFLGAGSGFWAHDPSGDLQMLFTPNLHKPLDFVTKDEKLQKLIREAVDNSENESAYQAVNQYLYDEGLINIYSHVRRFYFSKNKHFLKKSPLGYSAPTPWQVFEL
jgi:ABC-type transport system substrate-binding protein